MAHRLSAPTFQFQYSLIDFRDLDGAPLLASERIEDNLLAILSRVQNRTAAARQILKRISKLKGIERDAAFDKFLILAGRRKMEQTIREVAKTMPILNSIMEHGVIGPAIRQGLEQGRKEGRKEGRQSASISMLSGLMRKRFGRVPAWAKTQISSLSESELLKLSQRIFDAPTLEEVRQKNR